MTFFFHTLAIHATKDSIQRQFLLDVDTITSDLAQRCRCKPREFFVIGISLPSLEIIINDPLFMPSHPFHGSLHRKRKINLAAIEG